MSAASYCWQCGKKLSARGSDVMFKLVTPKGFDAPVRVHVICAINFGDPVPDFSQSRTKEAVHRYLGDRSVPTGDSNG